MINRRAAAAGAVWVTTLALGLGLARSVRVSRTSRAGEVSLWVADRRRGELVGLDRRLVPVFTLELDSPEHVARGSHGGVWVVAGGRLRHVGPDAAVTVDRPVAEVLDLATLPDGDLIVLERGGALRRHGSAGSSRRLVDLAGATALAARGARVLVACEDGWLAEVDCGPRPAVVGLSRRGGKLLALAANPGPEAGWWLLEAAGEQPGDGRRLTRLGPDGVPLWSRSVPAGAERLTSSSNGVWLTDPARLGVLEIGLDADQTAWIELPPALQQPRILIDLGAGILVGAHGALLALARDGSSVGSQGGFGELVDGAGVRDSSRAPGVWPNRGGRTRNAGCAPGRPRRP